MDERKTPPPIPKPRRRSGQQPAGPPPADPWLFKQPRALKLPKLWGKDVFGSSRDKRGSKGPFG